MMTGKLRIDDGAREARSTTGDEVVSGKVSDAAEPGKPGDLLGGAARVRDRIAGHVFLTSIGLSVRLTASIGVATHVDPSASADELLAAADAAMYWVKGHGKNGFHVAAPFA